MSADAGYPAELEADVALRDGSIAHIRPIRAEDEPRLLAFLRELSDDDRRMRFFSLGNDLSRTAHDEADVDYVHSLGLLATVGSPERIVGHALYAPSASVELRSPLRSPPSTRVAGWPPFCSGNWPTQPRPTTSTRSKQSRFQKTGACWTSCANLAFLSRPATSGTT